MQAFMVSDFAWLLLLGSTPLWLGIGWLVRARSAARRESMRRIQSARVRAGVLPRNIPCHQGDYIESDYSDSEEATLTEIGRSAEWLVVDEKPVLRLKYLNRNGQRTRCVINVERVDMRKMVLIGCCNGDEDRRSIPIAQIFGARLADSGRRFDIGLWVEAVRTARRRRGLPH